jgi:hypothetical protein
MARLLALSAFAVAASAVGPMAAGTETGGDPVHAVAELHVAAADDVRCAGPARVVPIVAALPVALPDRAPSHALGAAPSSAGRDLVATVAVHRLAPKTSPPARLVAALS